MPQQSPWGLPLDIPAIALFENVDCLLTRDDGHPFGNQRSASTHDSVNRQTWTFPAALEAPRRAREAARTFAAAREADRETVAAVVLCISEAVTNAVLHAYRDRDDPGAIEMTAFEDDDGSLWFGVRDDGHGLAPRPDSPGLGLGLPIISQTAARMEVRTPEEGGTEIVMHFQRSDAHEQRAG